MEQSFGGNMTSQPTPEKLQEWESFYYPNATGYAVLLKWAAAIATMGALAALILKLTWGVIW